MTPLLDAPSLGRLRSQLGGELVDELFELFGAQTSERLAELRAALDAGDEEAVARTAHTIRGGAATLALARTAEVAGRLEAAARDGSLDRAAPLVAELSAEFERARAALQLSVAE